MRMILAPAIAIVLIGASGELVKTPVQQGVNNPAYTTPPQRWQTIDDALEDSVVLMPEAKPSDLESCNDRITEAREASGQPPLLEREPASPEKPYAIYAVDREQDGCSVMVMMGNREDIRPLPLPEEGAERIMPADARR